MISRSIRDGSSIPTRFCYFSDDEETVIQDEGQMSWYDSRADQPTRSSEWRLYYTDNAVIGQNGIGQRPAIFWCSRSRKMYRVRRSLSRNLRQLASGNYASSFASLPSKHCHLKSRQLDQINWSISDEPKFLKLPGHQFPTQRMIRCLSGCSSTSRERCSLRERNSANSPELRFQAFGQRTAQIMRSLLGWNKRSSHSESLSVI